MGLFTGIKAMKAAKKVKNGGKAKFSYAMISMLIVNLQDAKAKLPPEQYAAVEKQFMDFQKCDTLFEVDVNGYLELCDDVIKKFDAIAPYEKYSGGNELEFSILMDNKRKEENRKKEIVNDSLSESVKINEEFIKTVLAENPMASREDAIEFYKVVMEGKIKGKQAALKRFDTFVDDVAKRNPQNAMLIIPYFCGALNGGGIISKAESDDLSQKCFQKLFDIAFLNK